MIIHNMTNDQKIEISKPQKLLFFTLNIISWVACVVLANSALEIMCISIVLLNFVSAKKLFGKLDYKFILKLSVAGIILGQIPLSLGLDQYLGMPVLPLWLISSWGIIVISLPFYKISYQKFFTKRI